MSGPSLLLHSRSPEPKRKFKCPEPGCTKTTVDYPTPTPKCPLHGIPMKKK